MRKMRRRQPHEDWGRERAQLGILDCTLELKERASGPELGGTWCEWRVEREVRNQTPRAL